MVRYLAGFRRHVRGSGHGGAGGGRRAWFAAVAAGAIAATVLLSTPAVAGDRVTVSGSSSIAPVLLEIAQRYESLHPERRVDVQGGGSSRGIADVRSGLADVGMISRSLFETESDLTSLTLALDGIGVVVHADNPVEALSDDDVRAIYLGEVRDWSEFGGMESGMTVVNKASGRATLDVFADYLDIAVPDIRADIIAGHNEQTINVVAGNPTAIAYLSIGATRANIDLGAPVRLLPLGDVPATDEQVESGAYPAVRELNLVVSGPQPEHVEHFLDYALSQEVHDIIRGLHYVPAQR